MATRRSGSPIVRRQFRATVTLTIGSGAEAIDVVESNPVQYRYEGNIFSGEKRSDLLVVPAASVRVSPGIAIIPATSVRAARPTAAGAAARPRAAGREVRVTVIDAKGASQSTVALDLPKGWTSSPAQDKVSFAREDETQTVRFEVRPAPGTPAGGSPREGAGHFGRHVVLPWLSGRRISAHPPRAHLP